ncbi:DNA-directed RNA polymerase subunit D [Candidatus Woesearchaeota archaeon]|nr:DNA-directed RNA polymerase subunit D [Candidatus Woesearchaeota archaeon]
MKISLVEKDDKRNIIVFDVEKTEAAYVNTLRRLFMTEVPILAVDEVEFKTNDSGLYDELVAHRLGLVPFTTDLKSYNLPAECKCKGEGCARCQLKMTLKAKGPGVVYSGDIKTKDPKVKPVFPKIPVLKLLENQSVEAEMTAVMGLGKNHAKWSPCLAYYKQLADIKIGSQPDNKENVAKGCPVKAFEVKNDKLVLTGEAIQCTMCGECSHLSADKITVTSTDTFRVSVESWGQLDPKDIVVKALEIYDAQLEEFSELVGKIK